VDISEQLVFELTVTDNDGATASDQITITVDPQANTPPTVEAGSDQSVSASQIVTLLGSSADSDGTVVTWQWSQLSGMPVTLINADQASASFSSPAVTVMEELLFELSVTDDAGASTADRILITINPTVNSPPTVNAGIDQTVFASQTVTLVSNSSDTDGDVVAWQWVQLSGTSVSLIDADQASLSFISPPITTVEQLIFEISVTDDDGATTTDQITITVEPAENASLTVDAGNEQSVVTGQLVTLSGSLDSNGVATRWQWIQLSGRSVTLINADQANSSFTSPAVTVVEQLEFQVTVTDQDGALASDQVTILVNPASTGPLPSFGPDLSQCPTTLADRGSSVVHVCDCQSGADTSCIPGNDGNAGTATSPLQSLSSVASAFNNGIDVAMCRGGAWVTTTGLSLDASQCSSATPCTLQDYGNNMLNKPLITIPQTSGSNGLELAPGSDQVRWEGIRVNNLHWRKSLVDGQGFGVFVFRNVNDVGLRCVELEGFGIGAYVNSNGIDTTAFTLSDSYIHNNGVMGWLGGTNQLLLERNHFHNNGWFNASALQHNVYLSETRLGGIVRSNWLSDAALDNNGQCVGTSLVAHNDNSVNLLIENNLIEESNPSPGCWGLTVDAAGSTTESHTNTIIRGNVLRNVGNISIGIASCVDCIIENNIVVQTMIGGATGIASPNRSTSPPDADVSGTIVRNNTVYFGGNASGQAYSVGERGSNYVVTNNIGYFDNPQPGDSCFNFDLAASAYNLVSNNLCFGAAFDSGTTGMDGLASSLDPQLLNPPDDLRPDTNSAAHNSGTRVSASAIDILGNARDASPDKGAYEIP
jgi:lipopolysaccharide export system protein LptC